MKQDDNFFKNLQQEIVELTDKYFIDLPINKKNKRTRKHSLDSDSNEVDPIESYKNLFVKLIDVFINHLSEKFHSYNFKLLIAISKLLSEDSKPDLGVLFFDLAIYCGEYDIDQLEKDLTIWYDYKQKQNLRTIKAKYKAFQEKDQKKNSVS